MGTYSSVEGHLHERDAGTDQIYNKYVDVYSLQRFQKMLLKNDTY